MEFLHIPNYATLVPAVFQCSIWPNLKQRNPGLNYFFHFFVIIKNYRNCKNCMSKRKHHNTVSYHIVLSCFFASRHLNNRYEYRSRRWTTLWLLLRLHQSDAAPHHFCVFFLLCCAELMYHIKSAYPSFLNIAFSNSWEKIQSRQGKTKSNCN
jgi:hypothetical protein